MGVTRLRVSEATLKLEIFRAEETVQYSLKQANTK